MSKEEKISEAVGVNSRNLGEALMMTINAYLVHAQANKHPAQHQTVYLAIAKVLRGAMESDPLTKRDAIMAFVSAIVLEDDKALARAMDVLNGTYPRIVH